MSAAEQLTKLLDTPTVGLDLSTFEPESDPLTPSQVETSLPDKYHQAFKMRLDGVPVEEVGALQKGSGHNLALVPGSRKGNH